MANFYRRHIHFKLPWRFRIWFDELWLRRDEFHPCYSMDMFATAEMKPNDASRYLGRLGHRRQAAHRLDDIGESTSLFSRIFPPINLNCNAKLNQGKIWSHGHIRSSGTGGIPLTRYFYLQLPIYSHRVVYDPNKKGDNVGWHRLSYLYLEKNSNTKGIKKHIFWFEFLDRAIMGIPSFVSDNEMEKLQHGK